MRIYHRRGAQVVHHGGTQYKAAPDGGFEALPGDVERHLLGFPDWETDVQREQRRVREDLARRRDPASQYEELAAMRAEMRAEARAPQAAPDLSLLSPEQLAALADAIRKAQAVQYGDGEAPAKPRGRRPAPKGEAKDDEAGEG